MISSAHRASFGHWWTAEASPIPRMLFGALTLAFLAFPFADVASGRISGGAAITAGAGLAAFAGLYLRLFWIVPRLKDCGRCAPAGSIEGRILLAALAALAVALGLGFHGRSGAEDFWLGSFVYVAVAAAIVLPIRLALLAIFGVAAVLMVVQGGFDSVALQSVLFGLLVLCLRGLSDLVEELDAARAQAAGLAVSEERLRVSRELHDLLGQNLSVIALKGELARKLLEHDPEAASREIRDVELVARESLSEAREAVRGLRRASLAGELDRACEALGAAGIEVAVQTAVPLPGRIEALFGAVVREAVTNVIRHSEAHRCELAVRRRDGIAELEIRDDGGVPGERAGDGSGLRGLAERVAEDGGTLEAGPAAGGFRLLARVPLPSGSQPPHQSSGEALAAWVDPRASCDRDVHEPSTSPGGSPGGATGRVLGSGTTG